MFCTRFKQGERVFLLSVSRCGISRRQVHLRGVTRWESGILNYELVFGKCFRFIIGEIPAWPRKNGNYGKKLLPTHIHVFSFPSPFSFLLVGGALARERPRRLRETKRAMGTRLTRIQNWTRNFCALFVKLNVDNQYICPTHPTHEALRKPCGRSAQTFHLHYVLCRSRGAPLKFRMGDMWFKGALM